MVETVWNVFAVAVMGGLLVLLIAAVTEGKPNLETKLAAVLVLVAVSLERGDVIAFWPAVGIATAAAVLKLAGLSRARRLPAA